MEIEAAYKLLEEQKEALEKLLLGYREKLDLSDNLRRSYDELLPKFQEARQELERQSREMGAKSEEIVSLTSMCENLKAAAQEKESALRKVSSAFEQLQVASRQKEEEVERRNRELATTLHNTRKKLEEQEMGMNAFRKEIEGLKKLLLESQKKCLEAETRAQAAKELREHEAVILKVEQEKAGIKEQLKWKLEQFRHLEEAHAKLKRQFHESEQEWKAEKSRIVDEVCSLQGNLEIQTRAVESLQLKLQMCNQALAHEQSRRRILEIQVSESRDSFENAVFECTDVKSKVEELSQGRDDEIAELRSMLSSKESQLKEVEIQKLLLEQENQDLKVIIKELRVDLETSISAKNEADKAEHKQKCNFIHELDQKSRRIEDLCKESSQLKEKLSQESHLKANAEAKIEELQAEHEACMKHLQAVILFNDEITKTLEKQNRISLEELAMKETKIEDLQHKVDRLQDTILKLEKSKFDDEVNMAYLQERFELVRKELNASMVTKDEIQELLEKQAWDTEQLLEMKDHTIEDLQHDTSNLRETLVRTSQSKLDVELAFKSLKDENEAIRNEFEGLAHVKMQIEEAFERERRNFSEELVLKDKNTASLDEKVARLQEELQHTCQLNAKANCEIRGLKDECAKLSKELKARNEEKERKIAELQRQITLVEGNLASQQDEAIVSARKQASSFLEKERNFVKTLEERDSQLNYLLVEVEFLEQNHIWKEIEAVVTLEQMRKGIDEIEKEKDEVIRDLQNRILSQEQLTKSVETAVSLELADRQFEIDMLSESLKKAVAVHLLDVQEKEFFITMNHELQQELQSSFQRLDSEEKLISDLRNYAQRLKCEMEKQQFKLHDLIASTQASERGLLADVDWLQNVVSERNGYVSLLLSDREFMVSQISEITKNIDKLSHNDKLKQVWQGIVEKAGCGDSDQEVFVDGKSHAKNSELSKHKDGIASEVRLPLKEHNGYVLG